MNGLQVMDFESFVKQATILAQGLINSPAPNDIEYLNNLDEMLKRVIDIPKTNPKNSTIKKGGDGWNWSTVVDSMPIYGIQLNMTAGSSLPAHDHRGYIGLVHVLDGQVKDTSYDQESAVSDDLVLSKISEKILNPGESTFVPLKSANIHTIQDVAGGSTLLDLLTIFSGNGDSYEIEIKNQLGDHYQASFTGSKI